MAKKNPKAPKAPKSPKNPKGEAADSSLEKLADKKSGPGVKVTKKPTTKPKKK